MATGQEKLDTFIKNGYSLDTLRQGVAVLRSRGLSDKEIGAKFDNAYNKLVAKETERKEEQPQQPEQKQAIQAPKQNYLAGTFRQYLDETTFGAGNIIAGATNVLANRAAGDFQTPTGELFKQGRREFKQQIEEFGEQNPYTAGVSKIAGAVTGLVVPGGAISKGVGGAVRGAKVASKLPMALREGAALTAGEAATFGAYSAIKQGAADTEKLRASEFAKGALKGGVLGGALGIAGRVSNPLTQMALSRVALKGRLAKAAQAVGSTAIEGAALGAVPAALEGEMPTAKDIGVGILTAGAFKSGATAVENALALARKKITTPTKAMLAQERQAAAQAAARENTQVAIDQTKAKMLDLKAETEGLKESVQASRKEVAQETVDRIRQRYNALEKIKENKEGIEVTLREREQKLLAAKKALQERQEVAENILQSFKNKQDKLNKDIAVYEAEQKQISSFRKDIAPVSSEYRGMRRDLAKSREYISAEKAQAKQALKDVKVQKKEAGNIKKLNKAEYNKAKAEVEVLTGQIKAREKEIKDLNKYRTRLRKEEALFQKEAAEARLPYTEKVKENQEALREARYEERYLQAEKDSITEGLRQRVQPEVQVSKEEVAALRKKDPNITSDDIAELVIRDAKLRGEAVKKVAPKDDIPTLEKIKRIPYQISEGIRTSFDKLRPLKAAVERYERNIGKLELKDNPALKLEEMRSGGFIEAELRPLADKVSEIAQKDKGAIQRASILAQAKKDLDFGVETSLNSKKVQALANDKKAAEIVDMATQLNQKALDALYQSGRIDETAYNAFKQNKNYVPSKRINPEQADIDTTIAQDIANRTKKYTGAEEVYDNAIVASMESAKSILRFADIQQAKKQAIKILSKTGEATQKEMRTPYTGGSVSFEPKNQIVIWEKGQPQVWNVPEKIADIFNPKLKPADGLATSIIKKIGGGYMHLFKGGTTAGSLGFALVNPTRDIQSVMGASKYGKYVGLEDFTDALKTVTAKNKREVPIYNELEKAIGPRGTLVKAETFKSLGEDTVQAVRDVADAAIKSQEPGSAGGLIANMFIQGLSNYSKKFKAFAGKFGKKTAEGFTYLGNASEEASRLTVFKAVLKGNAKNVEQYNAWLENPKTIPANVLKEAGREAREVTLNFNREMSPLIESANKYFVPYFKPAILGTMRAWEALTNPEVATNSWKFITNLGIAQGLINAHIADEEALKDFKDFNKEIAGKNFVIKGDKGRVYTFPLSQELAPIIKAISSGVEKMARDLNGTERKGLADEAKQSFKDMIINYTPLLNTVSPSNFSPGILKPALEQYLNKRLYSNTPIESNTNVPVEQRYYRSTSLAARAASQALSARGFELSPARIDHLLKSFTSSTGKEMLPVFDEALKLLGVGKNIIELKKEATDNPIVRRYIQSTNMAYSQTNLDAKKYIDKYKPYYSFVKKQGLSGLTEKQKEKYVNGYKAYAYIKDFDDELKKIYQAQAEIARAAKIAGNRYADEYRKGKISKADFEAKKEAYAIRLADKNERLEEKKLLLNRKILEQLEKKGLK